MSELPPVRSRDLTCLTRLLLAVPPTPGIARASALRSHVAGLYRKRMCMTRDTPRKHRETARNLAKPCGSAYAKAETAQAPRRCARPGGQDSSLYGNGRHGSGRRRTYKVLLRDMRTSDRRTTPSAEVLSYDSIRTHDGDLHMALPSSTGRHAGTVMGSRVPEYATTLPHLLSCPTVWFDDRSDSHSA